jgi:type IV pilus assembly protein PilC
MPVFSYTAIDEQGRKRRGQGEAASESALEAQLSERGQWLAEARIKSADSRPSGSRRAGRVPRRALTEFFLQISIQLTAGIPVFTALAFGVEESTHAGFRAVQKDLLERVEAGEFLSQAMAEYPRIFPPLITNLVRAGEASGRLAETFRELHRYHEWLDRMIADVRQALVYPSFVLISTLGFFFLLFTFLIPRFARLLAELKVPLPLLTRWTMGLSEFMVGHWVWFVAGPLLGFGLFKMGRRYSPRLGAALDRFQLRLPLLGSLLRLICLSRFAHNLAVLYRAGVPLLESLKLSRGLVGNRVVARAVEDIESGVNEGMPIYEVMARHRVFSKLILQMVKVGEATGSLGESLQNVADYYNEVIPRQIKKLFTIMEPAMILFLIGLVGTVALAIFLPIANLLGAR